MKYKYNIAPVPLSSTPSPVPPQDLPSMSTHSPSPLPFLSRSPSPWESADDSSKVLSVGMVKKVTRLTQLRYALMSTVEDHLGIVRSAVAAEHLPITLMFPMVFSAY